MLEGEAFLPCLVRELLDKNRENLRVAFLAYADTSPQQKVSVVKKHSLGEGDWLMQESDEYIESHISNMISYSEMIKAECKKHQIPYFDTSVEFQATINTVIESFKKCQKSR